VKEKFRAVLSHKGEFACPARGVAESEFKPQEILAAEAEKLLPEVVENLRKRGAAKPNTGAKLRKSVGASFQQASPELVEAVLVLLREKGYTAEDDDKVSYPGLSSGA